MRRLFRLALLALALLLVALASALAAMRFAIHGREVKTPRLVGLTVPKAEAVLTDAGLLLETDDRFFSENIPEGSVVSQAPIAGTNVRRGGHVRVAVSLGPTRETVPNVLGESGRAGEINVRRRGLEIGTIAVVHLPGLPADQVVAESPPPDSGGIVSPRVNLLLTAPEDEDAFVMPDFTGKSVGEAYQAIEQAGLKLANAPANNSSAASSATMLPAAARVLRQSPAAGQKVTPGTTVTLEIARPNPTPAAPAPPVPPN